MLRNAMKAVSLVALALSLATPLPGFSASDAAKKRAAKKVVAAKPASNSPSKDRKTPRKAARADLKKSSGAREAASTAQARQSKKSGVAQQTDKRPRKTLTASKNSRKTSALAPQQKTVRKIVVRNGKRQTVVRKVPVQVVSAVPPVVTAGNIAGLHLTHDPLALESNVALVVDQTTGRVLFEKNAHIALPIASITKLMTALVVIEAHQNMNEVLEVTDEDVDRERYSSSRLRVGSRLTRDDMLRIALMSSENRAASALGRHYPGGQPGFVAAMNAKAKALGMTETRFVDATGLSSSNVSSARDLIKLIVASHRHATLSRYSIEEHYTVIPGPYRLEYTNSNRLVASSDWEIGLQKTGYINEAGRCLAMQARIEGRPVVMVFLDSKGRYSRLADAGRVRKWLMTSGATSTAQGQVASATPKL